MYNYLRKRNMIKNYIKQTIFDSRLLTSQIYTFVILYLPINIQQITSKDVFYLKCK